MVIKSQKVAVWRLLSHFTKTFCQPGGNSSASRLVGEPRACWEGGTMEVDCVAYGEDKAPQEVVESPSRNTFGDENHHPIW